MIDTVPTTSAESADARRQARVRAGLTIFGWLVLVIPAVYIWAVYGFAFAYTEAFISGNCGPETGPNFWFGEGTHIGNWRGAGYESFNAAGAVGAVLWLGTGLGLWRARRWHGAWSLAIMIGFLVVFVASLFALWYVAAPLIWGPRHCGI